MQLTGQLHRHWFQKASRVASLLLQVEPPSNVQALQPALRLLLGLA